MTAIPISHRSKACFHCTEGVNAFHSTRSLRPWHGRFDHDRRFTASGRAWLRPQPFVCQGCVEMAAIVLDGVNRTEREKVLRRVHQRRNVRLAV